MLTSRYSRLRFSYGQHRERPGEVPREVPREVTREKPRFLSLFRRTGHARRRHRAPRAGGREPSRPNLLRVPVHDDVAMETPQLRGILPAVVLPKNTSSYSSHLLQKRSRRRRQQDRRILHSWRRTKPIATLKTSILHSDL
jgi:hypothetical protein